MQDAVDNRRHYLADGPRFGRNAVPAGEQQVPGPDQHGREHLDVSIRRDAPEVALDGEVRGDHGRRLRQNRDAGRHRTAQASAQFIPEGDEGDHRHSQRPEYVHQRAGEVVRDRAGPGCRAQGSGPAVDPADAVQYEFGEERVEITEVPVQDTLGAACLRGDRPAHYGGRMPTVPPEQPTPGRPEPHQYRQVAESFGADADRYDRTRPRYPDAMVERIIAASPGREVLDVGCGTGTAARQFQTAGCRVLGVEPDTRMADFARRSGVKVEVARFEAWDPAGRAFDAVVAGTAWHWVDPVVGAAKAAHVLRPGGRLAPFHHVFQSPPAVTEALASVYRRVAPDSPFNLSSQLTRSNLDAYQALFVKFADGIRATGGFSDPEQWRFDWECTYNRDEWLDQLPTLGALTQLTPDKLTEVQAGVGAAIDAMGGSFTMAYTTVVVTAARASNA